MSKIKSSNQALISVIIPAYNASETILRAVSSVLSQSYLPFELIIIDDGSTDCTLDLVSSFLNEKINCGVMVRLIKQENSGVSSARNTGIGLAVSEYIALLDADDEWMPEHLASFSRLIVGFPDAVLYFTGHKMVYPNRIKITNLKDFGILDGYLENYFSATFACATANSSNSCIRKSTLVQFGGFPEGVVAGEDLYVWIMLALRGKVACSSRVTSIVHINQEHIAGKRFLTVPYPIIYFSKRSSLLKSNPLLLKLLMKIGFKHYIFSVIKGYPRSAWLRLSALSRVSFSFALLLFPAMILAHLLYFIRLRSHINN